MLTLFPNVYRDNFAPHHKEFWEWVETLKIGESPGAAFFSILARGGGKTSSAEGGVVRVGATERRKFVLYVRSTQQKANESVRSISSLIERGVTERYYPSFAQRSVNKYGFSQGWKADLLRCSNGFNVLGLGLDAAIRGAKLDEFRPDLIILDDIDGKHDSAAVIEKKVDIITTSILPAGSTDVAILGMQNLIHSGSIFNRLVEGKVDFLHKRQVSGPHPAVIGLEYEELPQGGYRIVGGQPTWAGQDLTVCEKQINDWGLTAFLQESQHEVEVLGGGMFDHLSYRRLDWADLPDLVEITVWVDPAVSSTDDSDSMGIQADGIAQDDTIYRLWSWEQVTTPEDALKRAILKAIELGATSVGVETDQGGDTWKSVYLRAWDDSVAQKKIPKGIPRLEFRSAKAGAGHGSKVERAMRMLVDYERGAIVHVRGTHQTLEKALNRFPKTKPYDLTDAAYWSWNALRNPSRRGHMTSDVATAADLGLM